MFLPMVSYLGTLNLVVTIIAYPISSQSIQPEQKESIMEKRPGRNSNFFDLF